MCPAITAKLINVPLYNYRHSSPKETQSPGPPAEIPFSHFITQISELVFHMCYYNCCCKNSVLVTLTQGLQNKRISEN